MPRMPHHPTSAAARDESATAPGAHCVARHRHRLTAATNDTQAMRARIAAPQTAAAIHA